MPQSATVNRRILLNARPRGAPTAADLRIERGPVPEPGAGQVLLRTLYLSLDPYMRGRMSEGPSYAAPVALGDKAATSASSSSRWPTNEHLCQAMSALRSGLATAACDPCGTRGPRRCC